MGVTAGEGAGAATGFAAGDGKALGVSAASLGAAHAQKSSNEASNRAPAMILYLP